MKFKDLEKEIGFGPTVVVFDEQLPETFLNEFGLERLIDIYRVAPGEEQLEAIIVSKVKDSVHSFDDLLKIAQKSPAGTKLEEFALLKLESAGLSFDDWHKICRKAKNPKSKRKEISLLMMSKLATTFEQCRTYAFAPK